jgi:hypothetical protein
VLDPRARAGVYRTRRESAGCRFFTSPECHWMDLPAMNREIPQDLRDPCLYLNRELAQLEFNFRVLAQAQDPRVPLLERMRYLCISCTNLD